MVSPGLGLFSITRMALSFSSRISELDECSEACLSALSTYFHLRELGLIPCTFWNMEDATRALHFLREIEVLEHQSYNDLVTQVNFNVFQQIRDANSLCFSLDWSRCRGIKLYRQNLVHIKNEEIRHLHWMMRSKLKDVQFFHLRLLEQLSKLRTEIEGYKQGYSTELSETARFLCTEERLLAKYTPVIFHHSLVKGNDSVIPDLHYSLEAVIGLDAAAHLFSTLEKCRQFALQFHHIRSLQVTAKELVGSNEVIDGSQILQDCEELMHRPLDTVYLKSKKWKAVIQSSKMCTAKIQLIKAKVYQKQGTVHRQENQGGLDDPLNTQLSEYAEATFAQAWKRQTKSLSNKACWWYHVTVQVHTALGRTTWGINVNYGKMLVDSNRYVEALKLYKQAIRSIDRDEYDIGSVAEIMYLIGLAYNFSEQHIKSAKWFARALDFGLSLDSDAFNIYDMHLNYAYLLIAMHRFSECETVLNGLKYGGQEPTQTMCNCFGFLYLSWHKFELSEEWLRKGIKLHPKVKGNLDLNLCNLCMSLERLEEAEQIVKSYLISRRVSDKHYAVASMGNLYLLQKHFTEAEQTLKRALKLQNVWSINTWDTARTARLFGQLYLETRQYEAAEQWTKNALEVHYLKYTPSHVNTAICYNILAQVALSTDNLEVAGDNLQKALSICSNFPTFIETADVFHGMGMLNMKLEQYLEARDWLQKALSIQTQVIPQTMKTARTYYSLGLLSRAMNQLREAKDFFQAALSIQIFRFPRDRSTVDTYLSIAEVEELSFDFEAAELSLKTALHIMEELNPPHPRVREVWMRIGNVCDRLNKDEEAAEWRWRA